MRESSNRGRGIGSQRIRIIGGRFRGRKIDVANRPGLRPTSDRLRETLFNWVGPDMQDCHCLDLYAGSGAIGIEALSRGAQKVTFVDVDPVAMRSLRQNCDRLDCLAQAEFVQQDAQQFIQQTPRRWDVVFLDPPFQADILADLLKWFGTGSNLEDGAILYVEHAASAKPVFPPNLLPLRQSRVGACTGNLLRLDNRARTPTAGACD